MRKHNEQVAADACIAYGTTYDSPDARALRGARGTTSELHRSVLQWTCLQALVSCRQQTADIQVDDADLVGSERQKLSEKLCRFDYRDMPAQHPEANIPAQRTNFE